MQGIEIWLRLVCPISVDRNQDRRPQAEAVYTRCYVLLGVSRQEDSRVMSR